MEEGRHQTVARRMVAWPPTSSRTTRGAMMPIRPRALGPRGGQADEGLADSGPDVPVLEGDDDGPGDHHERLHRDERQRAEQTPGCTRFRTTSRIRQRNQPEDPHRSR